MMRPGRRKREHGDIPLAFQAEENGRQRRAMMKVMKGPRMVGMYIER